MANLLLVLMLGLCASVAFGRVIEPAAPPDEEGAPDDTVFNVKNIIVQLGGEVGAEFPEVSINEVGGDGTTEAAVVIEETTAGEEEGAESGEGSGSEAGSGDEAGSGEEDEAACMDYDVKCEEFLAQNQCEVNPTWMFNNCKATCGMCDQEAPAEEESEGEPSGGEDAVATEDSYKAPDIAPEATEQPVDTTEHVIEDATDAVTEAATEAVTEAATEAATETVIEEVTELPEEEEEQEVEETPEKPVTGTDDDVVFNIKNIILQLGGEVGAEFPEIKVKVDQGDGEATTEAAVVIEETTAGVEEEEGVESGEGSGSEAGSGDEAGSGEEDEAACMDYDVKCEEFLAQNQCEVNPTWMFNNCKATCGMCDQEAPAEASQQKESENPQEQVQY